VAKLVYRDSVRQIIASDKDTKCGDPYDSDGESRPFKNKRTTFRTIIVCR
jgi:hypothetical protein